MKWTETMMGLGFATESDVECWSSIRCSRDIASRLFHVRLASGNNHLRKLGRLQPSGCIQILLNYKRDL